MTDEAVRKKIAALLTIQRELIEKLATVTKEMDDLIGGGAGIGVKLKQCHVAWQAAWSARYHDDYAVTSWPAYNKIWKNLLQTFTPTDLQVRILNYLKCDDPFYAGKSHPLNLFVATINTWVTKNGQAFELDAPMDCHHRPRCLDEQTHTKQRIADLRA